MLHQCSAILETENFKSKTFPLKPKHFCLGRLPSCLLPK